MVADFDQLFDQAATVAPEKVLDKLTSLQWLNPRVRTRVQFCLLFITIDRHLFASTKKTKMVGGEVKAAPVIVSNLAAWCLRVWGVTHRADGAAFPSYQAATPFPPHDHR